LDDLNFLSLNPSKTEFLLIGLPQQLAKVNQPDNTTVTPVTNARNLGILFDSNFSFKQHINFLTKTKTTTVMTFDALDLHLILVRRLKIEQRIVYKLITLTYTALQHSPSYLANKLELQSNRSTRSASVITLRRPPVKLETGKRSFRSGAQFLWNVLPTRIRQPASDPLTPTPALSRDTFHKQLKAHLFSHSYPP